ncbi:MAG: ABC transporter substrate-binding protein [Wenzhouxiangellaceae bacterium]
MRLRLIGLLLCAIITAAPAAALDLDADPHTLVSQISDELFDQIEQHRDRYEQNQAELESLVREKFLPVIDNHYAARLILGREARKLEPQQIDDFATALSDLLVKRYAEGLLDFTNRDQMKVLPASSKDSEKLTRVRTRVRLTSGQEAPVDYIFRMRKQGWRVFDVVIEGISYVTTYRNQFGEEIRQKGFDAVLERIRSGDVQTDFDSEDAASSP